MSSRLRDTKEGGLHRLSSGLMSDLTSNNLRSEAITISVQIKPNGIEDPLTESLQNLLTLQKVPRRKNYPGLEVKIRSSVDSTEFWDESKSLNPDCERQDEETVRRGTGERTSKFLTVYETPIFTGPERRREEKKDSRTEEFRRTESSTDHGS